jgi:predicted nucleic acid-binding protein
MKILLDTSVFIGHLRGQVQTSHFLRSMIEDGSEAYYSVLTLTELWAGIRGPRTEADHLRVLEPFIMLDIQRNIAIRAGRLYAQARQARRSERDGLPGHIDCLLASTALEHGLTIATHNRRHFEQLSVSLYLLN